MTFARRTPFCRPTPGSWLAEFSPPPRFFLQVFILRDFVPTAPYVHIMREFPRESVRSAPAASRTAAGGRTIAPRSSAQGGFVRDGDLRFRESGGFRIPGIPEQFAGLHRSPRVPGIPEATAGPKTEPGRIVVFWRELTRPRWPFAPPRHPRKFTRAAPPADSSAGDAGKMPALQKTGTAWHARRVHPERAYIYYSARVKRLSVRANCG